MDMRGQYPSFLFRTPIDSVQKNLFPVKEREAPGLRPSGGNGRDGALCLSPEAVPSARANGRQAVRARRRPPARGGPIGVNLSQCQRRAGQPQGVALLYPITQFAWRWL